MCKTLSLISTLNNLSGGIIITTIDLNKEQMNDDTVFLNNVKVGKINKYIVTTIVNSKIGDKQLIIKDVKLNKALRKSIRLLKQYKRKE
jgi:hypothetical protein